MPIPSMKDVEPTKYSKDTKFKFKCHKGVKCFTQCCSKIDILLTPYDVLRMKNRLGISSEEFLETYTYMEIEKKISHPFAMLKMMDDPEKKCPFVKSDGCTIYTDRPANCRYYPIGQASMRKGKEKGSEHEEFFFFIREPHCLGYQEEAEWTIESWRLDQEVDLYDEMNREWKEIQLRQNLPGHGLDPNKQAQIYTAFYDLDRFNSTERKMEQIKNDEIALMNFGVKYAKYILMLEETLKLKNKT